MPECSLKNIEKLAIDVRAKLKSEYGRECIDATNELLPLLTRLQSEFSPYLCRKPN